MSPVPRTLDLTELRTFCVAAESGSLGRAALRLQVSQPSLSKRLASLERAAGARLLDRSSTGVTLTPAGRRLYEPARRLLEQAGGVEALLEVIGRVAGPVRLAASHSAAEAFVAEVLAGRGGARQPVELLAANSHVVRGLVADGAADIGVAAGRPGATPNPAVREIHLADDEVVCAVPHGHLWARLGHVTLKEFLRTPMVLRDPQSNARWTVEAVLHGRGLELAPPVAEAATPVAARREARARNVPTLLSRRVLPTDQFAEVAVDGLRFPRRYELVLPAVGDPPESVRALADELRAAVADWPAGG
jgi:DNA-binding transcriptional LysR family regulator